MKKEFFVNNRNKYFNKINDNSITILSSGTSYKKSADENFDYEVDKNFYYLSGINQEGVILCLIKRNGKTEEYLFIEKNDPILVKWVGAKLEIEEAQNISGIENVLYIDNYKDDIKKFITEEIKTAYFNLEFDKHCKYNYNHDFSNEHYDLVEGCEKIDCYKIIVGLRAIKEPEEIELIKETIDVTQIGIEKLMSESRPGIYEYQLENHFDFVIKENGQRIHSFNTIAAGGKNATILHYGFNNQKLKDGELVLFDLGTETELYISDITRTFPVNGKFTERQKQVYEEVLNCNKKCIEFLKPGITRMEYHAYSVKLLTESCKKLGLIEKDEDVKKYYFHGIGHSIGLDTHDPCFYENGIEENMILTVEPGLYIEEEGIGVRIEDDVLITKDGCINLSKGIIKEVDEIEEFFKKNNKYN